MKNKYFNFDKFITKINEDESLFYKQDFHPRLKNHSTIFLANNRLLDQKSILKIQADFSYPLLVQIQFVLPLPSTGFIIFYKDDVNEDELINFIQNIDINCLDVILNIISYKTVLNKETMTKDEDIQYYNFFEEQYHRFILKLEIDRAIKLNS